MSKYNLIWFDRQFGHSQCKHLGRLIDSLAFVAYAIARNDMTDLLASYKIYNRFSELFHLCDVADSLHD